MLKLPTFLLAFIPCLLPSLSAQELANVAGKTELKGKRVFYASHSLMWYVPDGATEADATYFLRTDDGVLIRVSNFGVGAPPSGLRFTPPQFVAPQGKYDWLNQSTFVGTLDVDWKRESPIRLRVFRVRAQRSP